MTDIVVMFAFELIALMLVVLFFWQARLARNMAKKWQAKAEEALKLVKEHESAQGVAQEEQ